MSLLAQNVGKTYGSGHTEIVALSDVSLRVEEGEIILIMGPSGSGKTTLITILGGLLSPSSGSVTIDGQEITKLKEDKLPAFRLSKIGFIFQAFNLLSSLTAVENTALPLIARGVGKKEAIKIAKDYLEKIGLTHRLNHKPQDLSGGEKQRVAIARALITNPSIILADEPTANLDSKNGAQVMLGLCSIACQLKKSVVIVSHDARIQQIAHRVIWIEDGRLKHEERGNHTQVCPHERVVWKNQG